MAASSLRQSIITEEEWPYPGPRPFNTGIFQVSGGAGKPGGHDLRYWEYGNPAGEPVLVMHGGPGFGSPTFLIRGIDPERYRIVMWDQRGTGESRPVVTLENPFPGLGNNTMAHAVHDARALLRHLDINSRVHVYGGSYGGTLATAFAIEFPYLVKSLVLRGSFLGAKWEVDLCQGVVPKGPLNPDSNDLLEVARANYFNGVLPRERSDMVGATYKRAFTEPRTSAEGRQRIEALFRMQDVETAGTFEVTPDDIAGQIRGTRKRQELNAQEVLQELWYFRNGCHMGSRKGLLLWENLGNMRRDTSFRFVQGREDRAAFPEITEKYVSELRRLGFTDVICDMVNAGHSAKEREIVFGLNRAFKGLLEFTEGDWLPRAGEPSGIIVPVDVNPTWLPRMIRFGNGRQRPLVPRPA